MYSFSLTTAVRGFHVYMDVWEPTLDEELACVRDIGNSHDTFSLGNSLACDKPDKLKLVNYIRKLYNTENFLSAKFW